MLHSFLHFGRILDDTTDVLTKAAAFAAERLTLCVLSRREP